MNFTEIIRAMETMTDAQIESIQKSAVAIMKIRDNERRVKAIQNFKEAFTALRKAGVCVSIECEGKDFYVDEYIENADRFDFS